MANYVTQQAVRAMQEIAQAQRDVGPIVGNLPAMDSAAGIYGAALKQMGVSDKDVQAVSRSTAGARALFQMARDRDRGAGHTTVAMDAATSDEYTAMFGPNATRLRHA